MSRQTHTAPHDIVHGRKEHATCCVIPNPHVPQAYFRPGRGVDGAGTSEMRIGPAHVIATAT